MLLCEACGNAGEEGRGRRGGLLSGSARTSVYEREADKAISAECIPGRCSLCSVLRSLSSLSFSLSLLSLLLVVPFRTASSVEAMWTLRNNSPVPRTYKLGNVRGAAISQAPFDPVIFAALKNPTSLLCAASSLGVASPAKLSRRRRSSNERKFGSNGRRMKISLQRQSIAWTR